MREHTSGKAPTTAAQQRFERLASQEMRSVSPDSGFLSGMIPSWITIWEHKNLLWLLVRRELKSKYKDSFLGFAWTLIRPLVQLFIYYFAIGKILGAERGIPDFGVYVFAGLTAWALFNEIVSMGTSSIVSNGGIIKKVYLPREIFPLAAAGAALINFGAQLIVLLTGAFFIRGILIVPFLIYVPIGVAILVVWGSALALWLSAVNVRMRDTQYLVEVGLLIGMWLSPIVYSFEMVKNAANSTIAAIYSWNPITIAVSDFQAGIWKQGTLTGAELPSELLARSFTVLAIGLLLGILAQRYFAHAQRNFAQDL
ncbi:ABC transporter permease [Arcanobacterium haemolyticum]|uniref:Transport permease protein n=1 Tax=Arcanobacterium haemolyticum (strain ATCC 9345 / DSM 20595 / CCM 5947 / CCUG 17215 / LMG 16163 / NBRC 15585 / NCTC 8452 / 11018) TaxID=644284 RepID=D7BLN5_ARCHD|nr:ABC transporter permease [Arcanobacterium haemolyticum]ADH91834.1 ABC-2 type transporter [Arcanobacterium haemolyticum DSM 20595]SQH27298.1 Vi polysaccharide export inner membrane protein VexB [Arcanobacterium haemolyticum]